MSTGQHDNADVRPALPVSEPTRTFKAISDFSIYRVVNEDIQQSLVEISGYDLNINFNMSYIRSVEDVEAACEGISQLFRDLIMEKLLANQKQ